MREIKFRGKAINGEYVYGLLTKKRLRNSGELQYAIATGDFTQANTVPVNEKTISQLVGYDHDGNEIYEGDELEGLHQERYSTQIRFQVVNEKTYLEYEIGAKSGFWKVNK